MRPRPDLLILGINYPPEVTGVAPYTGSLSAALHLYRKNVTALVAHPHYPEWAISEGYGQWTRVEHVQGVEVRRLLHYVPTNPRGVLRLLSEISFGMRLVTTRWRKPRVMIAVSPSLIATAMAALRARLFCRGGRFVVWVQDIYTLGLEEISEGGSVTSRIIRFIEARTLRSAHRVVMIHPRFADYAIRELGVEPSRIVIVRNWSHLSSADPVDKSVARFSLDWPRDLTLAVHTGNMGAKQGLENIVEAARLADMTGTPVHFVLIGDGGERRRLMELAQGIERITFAEPLDDEKYHMALSGADVLLVNEKPGVSAMAVPSKLTSYFHAGRPVIAATDVDGITASEIKTAQAGIVVPAGEPACLLDAIVELTGDPAKVSKHSASGRRYRDTVLDERTAFKEWTNLVDELLSESVLDERRRKRITD